MRLQLRKVCKNRIITLINKLDFEKDLLIQRESLGAKIPVNEKGDWELPLEKLKCTNVNIYLKICVCLHSSVSLNERLPA